MIDLLGDLGGVLEVIMVFTGAVLMPISEHHYILKAAKRMFMARTRDPTLFQKHNDGDCNQENNKKIIKYIDRRMINSYASEVIGTDQPLKQSSNSLVNQLKLHRLARLSLLDSVLLFLYNKFYCPSCKNSWPLWTWRKRSKLQRLYREAQHKLDHELNIVKLLR